MEGSPSPLPPHASPITHAKPIFQLQSGSARAINLISRDDKPFHGLISQGHQHQSFTFHLIINHLVTARIDHIERIRFCPLHKAILLQGTNLHFHPSSLAVVHLSATTRRHGHGRGLRLKSCQGIRHTSDSLRSAYVQLPSRVTRKTTVSGQ